MLTLISKIFVCLLAASALGLGFGWWLRRYLARDQLNDLRLSSQRAIADERSRYAHLDEDLARVSNEADALRTQLNAASNAALDVQQKHERALAKERAAQAGHEQALEAARAAESGARADLHKLAARLMEVDKRFTARTVELDGLLERLHTAEQECEHLKGKLAQGHGVGDTTLLDQAELRATQAGLQVADLERRLQDADLSWQQRLEQQQQREAVALEKLSQQLAGRIQDADRVQGELNEVRADFAALRLHVAQKDQLLEKAKQDLSAVTAQLDSAKRELGERDARLSQLQMVSANFDIELAGLRNDLSVKESQFSDLSGALQARVGEVERLREELLRREQTLLERQGIVAQYEREVAGLMAQRDRMQETLEQQQLAYATLQTELTAQLAEHKADYSAELSRWELRLEEQRRRALHAEEETQRAAETWKEATEAEAEARQESRNLRIELAALFEQRQGLSLQLEALRNEREQQVKELREQAAAAQQQLDEMQNLPQLPTWRAPRPREIDDLQLIWGVGPKLEKLLHSLGIWTFRQIASWTRRDIAEVDQELQVFHGRIDRDGWVASAREEHFKKFGERI